MKTHDSDIAYDHSSDRGHRKKKRQKKPWQYVLLGCFLVIVGFVFYWTVNPTALDGYLRDFTYKKTERDENGNIALYSFASDKSTAFGEMNGSLLLANQSKVQLISDKGQEIYTESSAMLHPAIIRNDSYALCYDIGSSKVYLFSAHGLLFSGGVEGEITDAFLRNNGDCVIVYKKSGYKSCVCVLDKHGDKLFEFNSSNRFVMTACCSNNHKILASVTLGQEDGQFISYVVLYRTNATEPYATISISDTLIYDIGCIDGVFCCVGEDALYFIGQDGKLQDEYSFGTRFLRNCSIDGNNYATLFLSDYKAGSQGLLLTIDKHGNEIGGYTVDDEILHLSCSGNYVVLLDNVRVTIFDKYLNRIATQESITAVETINARSEGTAVLISTNKGVLFVP